MTLDVEWVNAGDVTWVNAMDTQWLPLIVTASIKNLIFFTLFIKQANSLELLIGQSKAYQLFIQQQEDINMEF